MHLLQKAPEFVIARSEELTRIEALGVQQGSAQYGIRLAVAADVKFGVGPSSTIEMVQLQIESAMAAGRQEVKQA